MDISQGQGPEFSFIYYLLIFWEKEKKIVKRMEDPRTPGNSDLNKINNFQQQVNSLIFLTGPNLNIYFLQDNSIPISSAL